MKDLPFGFDVIEGSRLDRFDHHIERPLSTLKGLFADAQAYQRMLAEGDRMVYEVYEVRRPAKAGELLTGLSVVHPGRVGGEYFMTKGHYHLVRETAEIYYGVAGRGLLLMQEEGGGWAVEEFRPGRAVYVPPCWAHRSVNTGDEDLVTLFAYPGHAGHDYGAIEQCGFQKLVLRRDGEPQLVDNAAWARAMETR